MATEIIVALIAAWLVPILVFAFRGVIGQIIASLAPALEPRSVRGEWDTQFLRRNAACAERAKVKQFLHKVWGTIDYPDKGRRYKFHGTLRDNVLTATYDVTKNRSAIDRGAFTIKLNNDGNQMAGKYSWTDDDTSDVYSDDYLWQRPGVTSNT